MACHGTELPVNYLKVAILSRTGNVGVWHAMTQNWQVIILWWLYSARQARFFVSHAMTENWQVSQINKTQFACYFYNRKSENINSILCYIRPR